MPIRIALVHRDSTFLAATERGLACPGFVVSTFNDFLQAWGKVTRGGFDVLVAQVGAPAGQPCGVALAMGATFSNPALEAVLLATRYEAEYAERVGEVLSAAITPEALIDQLVFRFAPAARAA